MPVFTNISAYKFAPLGNLTALFGPRCARCATKRECAARFFSARKESTSSWLPSLTPPTTLLNYLRTIPGLADLAAKISHSDHQPFNRMLVKIKKEIIAFGVAGIDPGRNPAPKSFAETTEGMARPRPAHHPSRRPQRLRSKARHLPRSPHARPRSFPRIPNGRRVAAPSSQRRTGRDLLHRRHSLRKSGAAFAKRRFRPGLPTRWRHSPLFRGMRRRTFRRRLLRVRQTRRARSFPARNRSRPLLRLPDSTDRRSNRKIRATWNPSPARIVTKTNNLGLDQNRVAGCPRPIETRSLPTLTRSYPRRFTFYVARPARAPFASSRPPTVKLAPCEPLTSDHSILRAQRSLADAERGFAFRSARLGRTTSSAISE